MILCGILLMALSLLLIWLSKPPKEPKVYDYPDSWE